jgi:hypothetical protein
MKFMMFVLTDPTPDTASDESDVELWVDDLDSREERILGDILDPSRATVVRVRDGEQLLTEGPSDTMPSLWGFDLLECDDLARAIELAAAHPMARNGRIEIRPFPTN